MGKLTDVDMLFWGNQVGMADEDDEKKCVKLIKSELNNNIKYSKCNDSVIHYEEEIKKYFCGVEASDLKCQSKSIHFFDLANQIRTMVSPDLKLDAHKLINQLIAKGYITIYECSRIFISD